MRSWVSWTGLLLLAACSGLPLSRAAAPFPAPIPSPTVDLTSLLPSPTPGPLTESTPPLVLEPPVPIPSPTPALVIAGLPPEKLSILLPGPGSQVTSPFQILGRGGPSLNQRVQLRLIDSYGAEINRTTTYLFALPQNAGRFVTLLSFSIEGVAADARLEAAVQGPRSARLSHLSTVDLVLLGLGTPLIHTGSEGPEKLTIFEPHEGSRVSGGRVTVRGAGWVNADVPLQVQVIDQQGTVLASAEVALEGPGVGDVGTFEVDLAYSVPWGQFGRIAVIEPGTSIPGMVHYSSIEVYLEP
ncbi:MAG TPA: hypothetical protein VGA32_07740 [Anaerolineales bacterium]